MQTITYIHVPGRRLQHQMQYRVGGTRETRSFETKTAALRWKKAMEQECEGVDVPLGLERAVKLFLSVPPDENIPFFEAFERGLVALRAGNGSTLTIDEACDRYITKLERERAREETIASYKRTFAPLKRAFSGRRISTIERKEFEEWLANPKWSPTSQHKHHRHCRPVWNDQDLTFPGAKWKKPQEKVEPVDYFTYEQVHLLFLACPIWARGHLALMMFAGIRPEAAWQYHDNLKLIDHSTRTITIPYELDKTSPHDVIIHDIPEHLFAWLRAFPMEKTIDLKNLHRRLTRDTGMRWIQDGCRHTAATSWLAVLGMDECRRLLNHAGFTLIKKHYACAIDKARAKAFLSLTPEMVYPDGNPKWMLPDGEKARQYLRKIEITPELVRIVQDDVQTKKAA